MKTCPFCAEQIQDDAIVCRYCGRDFPNAPNNQKENTEDADAKRYGKVVLWSVIGTVAEFCFFILFLAITNSDQFWAAHEAVKKNLIDPSSAKFKDEVAVNNHIVCGYVNAKNRMGAYSGNSPYIVISGTAIMIDDLPKGNDLQMLRLTDTGDAYWKERYEKIDYGCSFMSAWKSYCEAKIGSLSDDSSTLCQAWKETGGNIILTMHKIGLYPRY